MGEKEELLNSLKSLYSKRQFSEVLKHWAESDELLDYKGEIDFDIAGIVTQSYLNLYDYKNTAFYALHQVNYLQAKTDKPEQKAEYISILMLCYYKLGDFEKLLKLQVESANANIKLVKEYLNEVPEQDKILVKLEKSKKYTTVYWAGAILLGILYLIPILSKSIPNWFSWIRDGFFYPYIAYIIVPPFRRWLIKGWVKQFVKID